MVTCLSSPVIQSNVVQETNTHIIHNFPKQHLIFFSIIGRDGSELITYPGFEVSLCKDRDGCLLSLWRTSIHLSFFLTFRQSV